MRTEFLIMNTMPFTWVPDRQIILEVILLCQALCWFVWFSLSLECKISCSDGNHNSQKALTRFCFAFISTKWKAQRSRKNNCCLAKIKLHPHKPEVWVYQELKHWFEIILNGASHDFDSSLALSWIRMCQVCLWASLLSHATDRHSQNVHSWQVVTSMPVPSRNILWHRLLVVSCLTADDMLT